MEQLRARHVLTLCVIGLLCVGVIAVESAASNVASADADDPFRWTPTGIRHALLAAAALLFYWVGTRLEPSKLIGKLAVVAFLVAAVGCVAVLIPGIGISVNGARRWLPLGPVQVQASELAKWATPLLLAWWCTREDALKSIGSFAGACLPVAVVCGLVAIQDLGTAVLIAAVAGCILLVAGAKLWHLGLCTLPAAAMGAFFVIDQPYRVARLTSFLDPWADAEGKGYHMVQALASFAHGGFTGTGLGRGVQKLGYLPEDTTDFIYATLCEETGFFGAAVVVLLFLGIVGVCWKSVHNDETPAGPRLLALGVGLTVGLQATMNLAVATVSMPTKGISLPLVSAGGSGLLLCGLMLGIMRATLPAGETRIQSRPGSEPTPLPA
ncbi:MAG: putative peptidoglycan glycosyltransferase FtsW [Planctomycetota bacterium]